MEKILQAPSWAPNAIPTNKGWINPKTNELLVSKRGLLDDINKIKASKKIVKEPVKEEPVKEEPKKRSGRTRKTNKK
jgi:hypothetical protein